MVAAEGALAACSTLLKALIEGQPIYVLVVLVVVSEVCDIVIPFKHRNIYDTGDVPDTSEGAVDEFGVPHDEVMKLFDSSICERIN